MINFSKEISESNLLSAYNIHNVKFSSSSIENAISCSVVVNGLPYYRTPNLDNEFTFNFGGIESCFAIEVNRNNFIDSEILNVSSMNDLILVDNSSYISLEVIYTITLADDTTDTINKTYNVLRSVNKRKKPVSLDINDFHLLQNNNNVNYYVGYPNDVSIYSGNNDDFDIDTNNNTITVEFNDGINRLILSDGLNGLNDYSTIDSNDTITIDGDLEIKLNKIDDCGLYVKYLNSKGGWSNWLFKNYKEDLKIKSLKNVFNDYDDDSSDPYLSIGKTSQSTITAHSKNVSLVDMENLNDLFKSNKVYLFIGEKGEKMHDDSFIAVEVTSKKQRIKNYKGDIFNVDVTIELPLDNNTRL